MESLPKAEESDANIPDLGTPEFDAFIKNAIASLNRTEEMWASAGFDDESKVEAVREMLDPESQVEFDMVLAAEKRELDRQRKSVIATSGAEVEKPKKERPKRTRISI